MQKDKALKLLGKHINIGCHSAIKLIIRDDASFSSHRFMYKIVGSEKILELLSDWMLNNSKNNAYESFYKTRDYIFKPSLQPCILLVGEHRSDFISILTIKMKRGKIQEIKGLDPKECSPTRGELII